MWDPNTHLSEHITSPAATGLCEEPFPLSHDDLPIHKAALKGEIQSLVSLISTCEDVDVRSVQSCTALHLAIRGNHEEAVRLLLSAGADPTLKDYADCGMQLEFNAVDLASYVGSQHAMAVLIDAGLGIPGSAFERCASLNHIECMQTLFDKLPDTGSSDCSRQKSVRLALGRAACCWHLEAVEFLLTKVAGFPDVNNREDRDALRMALDGTVDLDYICIDECRWRKNAEPERYRIILEKLVTAGAGARYGDEMTNDAFWTTMPLADRWTIRFLLQNGLISQDGQDMIGQTPLFGIVGIQDDDLGLAKAFIAAGADVKHKDLAHRTPMHYATNCALVELLHEHGADLFAKDKYGMTPFHLACTVGRSDIIEFLVSKGAIVDEAANRGWTPLLCSSSNTVDASEDRIYFSEAYTTSTRISVAKLLLGQGANVQARTSDGQTVLHGVAQLYETELIRHLIDQGADVRATMANGVTALHNAARAVNIEAVRVLLDRGADIHAVSTAGETILHAACSGANLSTLSAVSNIVEIILEIEIEVDAKDPTGSTALHILYDRCYKHWQNDPETFNLLLRKGAAKFVRNDEEETIQELIESDSKWVWNIEGLLKKAPPPPRGPNWRGGRGRGGWGRGRGGPWEDWSK